MPRVDTRVVVLIGLLVSVAAKADDEIVVQFPGVPDSHAAISGDATDSDLWRTEIDTFDFQDNSPLGRISRIRDLPLLTISQSRSSRLFLGVNRDGVFGLHLRAR